MTKNKILLATVILLGLAGGASFLSHSPRPVVVTSFAEGAALMPPAPLLDRVMPPWGWLWRLKDSVLPRQPINFDVAIMDSKLTPEKLLADLPLGEVAFSTNGLRVWFLDKNESNQTQQRLMRNSSTHKLRANTGEGIRSGIAMTHSVVIDGKTQDMGTKMDLMPLLTRDSIDLTALISFSEAATNHVDVNDIQIKTGLALAIRLEIPNDKNLFLLDVKRETTNKGSIGVIISPSFPKKKK